MNDLESRLARLGTATPSPVSEAQVAADLAASRRAARERAARRTTFGALATLGVAAVAGVAIGTSSSHPAPAPEARPAPPTSVVTPVHPSHPATTRTTSPAGQHGPLRLVAYTGKQQPGFTVASVPEGYVLQGADKLILAVARADDDSPIYDFSHKLIVTIGSLAESGPPQGDAVTVNGQPGAIRGHGDGATTLSYVEGDRLVQIQQWSDIDLSHAQLVRFAEGITVTASAEDSHG